MRLHDLDINQHVNHRVNIEWIIEGTPEKILKNYKLVKIEISYKEQAFLEDKIVVETEFIKLKEKDQIKTIHQIMKEKKNKLVSKAIIYWSKL